MVKKRLKCRINSKTGEFDCKTEKGPKFRGKCKVSPKGKQGGASLFGSGASFGDSKTELRCDDETDFRKAIGKKYPKFEIEIEDE